MSLYGAAATARRSGGVSKNEFGWPMSHMDLHTRERDHLMTHSGRVMIADEPYLMLETRNQQAARRMKR